MKEETTQKDVDIETLRKSLQEIKRQIVEQEPERNLPIKETCGITRYPDSISFRPISTFVALLPVPRSPRLITRPQQSLSWIFEDPCFGAG
jgi:hypothetical protein